MSHVRRMRRKFQRGLCPYDDAISQLKGGMQSAPKWLDSVRKYPPSKMHLTPGKVGRPSEFWNDRIRNILLRNRRRPEWIPSLPTAQGKSSPQVANIMSGAHFNDAFGMPSHASDPDIEFAACQAWFMTKKGLSEDEAYEQARFRMRDLLKQKERVWEVYRRKLLLSNTNSDANDGTPGYKQYKDERTSLTDSWINLINNKMQQKMQQMYSQAQNIHNSSKSNPNIPVTPKNMYEMTQGTGQSLSGNDMDFNNLDMSKVSSNRRDAATTDSNDPNGLEPQPRQPRARQENPWEASIRDAQQTHSVEVDPTRQRQVQPKMESKMESKMEPNMEQTEQKLGQQMRQENSEQGAEPAEPVVGQLFGSEGNKIEQEQRNTRNDGNNRNERFARRERQREERRKKYGAMTDEELELEKIRLYEEEKQFNKDWENQVKLLRFIEYSDYISKNPHLGLSDPTELLKGLPKTSQKDKEIYKRLLMKMSQKQANIRFLKK